MSITNITTARSRLKQRHADYVAGIASVIAAEVEERGWDGEEDDLKDLTATEVTQMIDNAFQKGSPMHELMHVGLARGCITTQGKYRQWTEESDYLLSIGKTA